MVIKYLILDGNDYKTITYGVLQTVCTTSDTDTVIENAFRTNGMNDLTQINTDITNQILNSNFTITMFKSAK